MKLEIKFRAWDTKNKKMSLQPFTLEDIFFGGGNTYAQQLWERNNRLVFMQYTGLKDKNGKEIYEGDIIGRKGFVSTRKIVSWNSEKATGVGFNVSPHKKDTDWEILGNIHQNPDLLK